MRHTKTLVCNQVVGAVRTVVCRRLPQPFQSCTAVSHKRAVHTTQSTGTTTPTIVCEKIEVQEKDCHFHVSLCRRASYIQLLIHVTLSVSAEGLIRGLELEMSQSCTHARTHARKHTHKRQKTEIVEKWIVKKNNNSVFSYCRLYSLFFN